MPISRIISPCIFQATPGSSYNSYVYFFTTISHLHSISRTYEHLLIFVGIYNKFFQLLHEQYPPTLNTKQKVSSVSLVMLTIMLQANKLIGKGAIQMRNKKITYGGWCKTFSRLKISFDTFISDDMTIGRRHSSSRTRYEPQNPSVLKHMLDTTKIRGESFMKCVNINN